MRAPRLIPLHGPVMGPSTRRLASRRARLALTSMQVGRRVGARLGPRPVASPKSIGPAFRLITVALGSARAIISGGPGPARRAGARPSIGPSSIKAMTGSIEGPASSGCRRAKRTSTRQPVDTAQAGYSVRRAGNAAAAGFLRGGTTGGVPGFIRGTGFRPPASVCPARIARAPTRKAQIG